MKHISLIVAAAAVIAVALPGTAFAGSANGHTINTLAVYGDAPYFDKTPGSGDQKLQLSREFLATPAFIDSVNADPDVSTVMHVGDIHSGQETCRQDYDQAIFDMWTSYQDPLVYTPGDNEWSDCSKLPGQAPATNPATNLAIVRSIFFSNPGSTLGANPMKVTSQADVGARGAGDATDANYPENVEWVKGRTLFVTLNVPGGSNNDKDPWFGAATETAEQTLERTQRTAADLDWLNYAFAIAQREHAIDQVVVAEQADMWDSADVPAHVTEYEPIVKSIADHTLALGKPVLLFNGDTHVYRSDNPLSPLSPLSIYHPGYDVPNFHRLVVQGSAPKMEWLKVTIDSGVDNGASATSFGPFSWVRKMFN
jgi:hypothetical protein